MGNRKTMVTGAGTTQYAYDAADRLTSVTPPGAGAITYTFDDNGNLTDRGSDDFVWDADDRLTSATVDSVTTTFTYNGDGLRDSLTLNSSTTTFTWDVGPLVPQLLDDEAFKYVYGIDRVAQVAGSGTHYYLSDLLGSTMVLTDEDGDVVNDYEYDVFGAVRDSSGSQSNEFTFAGEQLDEHTDLQYLRARFYDQATGRLLSKDPLEGSELSPQTQNAYVYTQNNPVILTDPRGLAGEKGGGSGFISRLCGWLGRFRCDDGGGKANNSGGGGGGGGKWVVGGKAVLKQLTLDAQRLKSHIIPRHGYESRAGASRFLKDTDYYDLVRVSQHVKPTASVGANGQINYVRTVNAGRQVGLDHPAVGGSPTNYYTVVSDAEGNVVTMHPGFPFP